MTRVSRSRIEIVPLQPAHVDRAADLLVKMSQTGRQAGLHVPAKLLDLSRAMETLGGSFGNGPAVAAFEAGRLIGFLRADPASGRVRLEHYAAAPGQTRQVIQHLYAAIADALIGRGLRRHEVDVLAGSSDVIEAWFQLGFGLAGNKGLPPPQVGESASPEGVTVRSAVESDVEAMADLAVELNEFHEESPMFHSSDYPRDRAAANLRAELADANCFVCVADCDGQRVGFMSAYPDHTFDNTVTIGIAGTAAAYRGRGVGSALVGLVDAWAVDRKADLVGVGWNSANLVSDSFWRGLGFIPARLTLAREFRDSRAQT
jgi:GNAT superfamily N-acetyltransferase